MPEDALLQSAQIAYRHARPSLDDIRTILSQLESERYLSATTEPLSDERVWTLTAKGQAQLGAITI